jgi:hypothetical protein
MARIIQTIKARRQTYGMRLFKEIVAILHTLSRTVPLRRSDEKSNFLTIAKQAEKLASLHCIVTCMVLMRLH